MLNFNWNSIEESTFQGHLNKYTNAFKGYQTRYFVLDPQTKNLFYFMPDEVRKKGPRGLIELTDCWISPSNEDDITFTVQTSTGEIFKFRASDAKERQKWIDKLRTYSGTNAANVYVSSLPIPKLHQTNASSSGSSPNESQIRPSNQRNTILQQQNQTIKDLKEVIRCVEVNQREFVDTIDAIPDDAPRHSLSKEMLLLRSISQSCINSLREGLTILSQARTLNHESFTSVTPSGSSIAIINTSTRSANPSVNINPNGRSNLSVGLSSQSTLFNSQNKMSSLSAMNEQNESNISVINHDMNKSDFSSSLEFQMSERENQLSLLSIEVLISDVQIELNVECHLPSLVFRLLDYPAVSIPFFDQWQVEDFHQLKKIYPNVSWRQLLSDQFYELRSANGKWKFNRGKSCLFKCYFPNFYQHLLNVPLFLLLIDQIHEQNINQSHFIGSGNVKLNELIEVLNQSIRKNGNDVPLVEQQTFHCTLFNLMGTRIGNCDLAVRFCHYGTTILTQLPMLDEKAETKVENKIIKEPEADTIVKHIHLVNEKKDVGLQISRSDLPRSSDKDQSAQTRWTSTKNRPVDYHQTKSRYLRTMEDPSLDDSTIAFYRPPPLYFNSDSDFLQMMTPATTRVVEKAKENRLSYLASIPIASFDGSSSEKETAVVKEQQPKMKRKSVSMIRTDLPSTKTTGVSRTKMMAKQTTLGKDFLHHFPLLRALVEEALALQQHQGELPISMLDKRPHSAVPLRKGTPIRPRSAATARSVRSKSVIMTRNINNTRRLYPPPSKTNPMGVTKVEMRYLVDRLSTPKVNKRVERELVGIKQNTPEERSSIKTPRQPSKPISPVRSTQKPSLSYGTTRSHRLMAELSRARRGILKPSPTHPPKSQTPPKKPPTPKTRFSPSPPQIINTTTVSQSSLLNKVDVDTPTVDKQNNKRPSLGVISENTSLTIESVSTTSKDVTLKLNRTLTMPVSSTPKPIIRQQNQENDDLNFSISDVTDYFTDGVESSAHP